jgi:hypothetical protein
MFDIFSIIAFLSLLGYGLFYIASIHEGQQHTS